MAGVITTEEQETLNICIQEAETEEEKELFIELQTIPMYENYLDYE